MPYLCLKILYFSTQFHFGSYVYEKCELVLAQNLNFLVVLIPNLIMSWPLQILES